MAGYGSETIGGTTYRVYNRNDGSKLYLVDGRWQPRSAVPNRGGDNSPDISRRLTYNNRPANTPNNGGGGGGGGGGPSITVDSSSQDARVRDPAIQAAARRMAQLYGRDQPVNDNTLAAIERFITDEKRAAADKKAELAKREDRALTQNYQDRILAQQEKTLTAQTQYNKNLLAFNKAQAADTKEYREKQLAFQKTEADKEAEYRAKVLARDAKQREEDLAYRQSLLDREDKQRAADLAERQRVEAERNAQWEKQFELDKTQHAETLAFQKKTARQTRKLRVKAEAQAEAGTRQKVLASLGFTGTVDRGKISNPVEQLLIRAGRQRRRR